MKEYKKYIRCHIVKATPMTRGEYNKHRGWIAPVNENAADEGYHIVYPDGYESWCPKAQFEAAGRPIDNMTYGMAIDACRYKGAKIQRANWNGEGQFVRFESALVSEDGKLRIEDGMEPEDFENMPPMVESECFVFHFVSRKTGVSGVQVGWLASQADMAASDWRIVD